MLLEKFDKKKYERTLRSEGKKEGRDQERECLNRLTQILIDENRIDDLRRATEDVVFQEQLLQELHLNPSSEEDEYWWLDCIG